MSQQSKPRVYTFDEICESQDFNHEHEFVDKEALDEARKEIERKKQTLIERYDIINEYEEKELQWNEKLATANVLLEKIRVELGNQIRYYDASLPLAVRRENVEPEAQILSSLKGLWEEIEQHRDRSEK